MKYILLIYIIFTFIKANSLTKENIDFIKSEMGLNETILLNAPTGPSWTKGAVTAMGLAPRGDASPSWWLPSNTSFKTSNYWNAISPWFVVFPGVNHKATNTRIKIYGVQCWVQYKSTGKWIRVNPSTIPSWAQDYDFRTATRKLGTAPYRIEPDSNISYKLKEEKYALHGGVGKFEIKGSDLKNVFIRIKTKLVIDDPLKPDDRDKAEILLSAGIDYYPSTLIGISDFSPMGFVPNVVGSRFSLVKKTERIHLGIPLDPPGNKSGGSLYYKTGGKMSWTFTDLETMTLPGFL